MDHVLAGQADVLERGDHRRDLDLRARGYGLVRELKVLGHDHGVEARRQRVSRVDELGVVPKSHPLGTVLGSARQIGGPHGDPIHGRDVRAGVGLEGSRHPCRDPVEGLDDRDLLTRHWIRGDDVGVYQLKATLDRDAIQEGCPGHGSVRA